MKIAIFPGSFDPLHEGHLNIIEKASKLFDKLWVVVTFNNEKTSDKSLEQRFENIIEKTKHFKNVIVKKNSNEMTYEFAKNNNINYLVRSARNNIDFKYELELAVGNKSFNNSLETILLFPDGEKVNFSSRLEKQKIK